MGRTLLNSKASFSRASSDARGSSPSSSFGASEAGTESGPVTGVEDEAIIRGKGMSLGPKYSVGRELISLLTEGELQLGGDFTWLARLKQSCSAGD